MKSLDLPLFEKAYADVCANANIAPNARDLATVRSRFEHEGDSFLTITLADFGKHFIASLEAGAWRPIRSFRRRNGEALPAFLQGALRLVFSVSDGRILSQPSTEAVGAIWQLSQMFPKVKMECTDERRHKAEKKFIQCENDLNAFRPSLWSDRRDFIAVCRTIYGGVLDVLSDKLRTASLLPKHGRGGTAEGVKGDPKFLLNTWPKRVDRSFPFDLLSSSSYGTFLDQQWNGTTFLSKHEELPAKVVFVPKTLKTPRVIAAEPIAMQYTQQSLAGELVSLLEKDSMVRQALHFTDQTVNATRALESSLSKEYSTLDLSEASDRVHAALVYDLFSSHPALCRATFDCRSVRARLPSGKVIPLKKFASMGSALCFPCEAMVFLSLTIVAHLKHDRLRPTNDVIHRYLSDILVYGDDIIVKKQYLDETVRVLENARLVVNRSKTFSNGSFRESCGTDAFAGVDITPVRVRSLYPTDRTDKDAIASCVSTANQFYWKAMWRTCEYLRSKTEDIVGWLPHVSPKSSILGWTSVLGYCSASRYNIKLHRLEVKGFAIQPKRYKSELPGYQLLMKYFLGVSPSDTSGRRENEITRDGSDTLAYLFSEKSQCVNEYTVKFSSVMRRIWAPI